MTSPRLSIYQHLLLKLDYYGISGNTKKWITSFLDALVRKKLIHLPLGHPKFSFLARTVTDWNALSASTSAKQSFDIPSRKPSTNSHTPADRC